MVSCERLTWFNVSADKLQHNISCPYTITDGIQMLQHGISEILSDLVPHCYHSSDLELHRFLCMHSQCGLNKILTDSCYRKPWSPSQPRTSCCVVERKRDRIEAEEGLVVLKSIIVKKQFGGKTHELIMKSQWHVWLLLFHNTTYEALSLFLCLGQK